MKKLEKILKKNFFFKNDIVFLLSLKGEDCKKLFQKAREIKLKYIGNKVYYRGLIELSNNCIKDCFYCGIRKSNKKIERYFLNEKEIIESALFSYKNNYASIVIQSGEIQSENFSKKIENILKKIHQKTGGKFGITLSVGEQKKETYKRWLDAGASRYLLRIETTNKKLYKKIHPNDETHNFHKRLKYLKELQNLGYQTGTGVLIGLPFQTLEDLADDLLFFKSFDIDMVGMGPYIEHINTPLYKHSNLLLSKENRLELSLKMIAILRILMKDINIAATTAMQTLDENGHIKALMSGANILMPNTTPTNYKKNYLLYENKERTKDQARNVNKILEERVNSSGNKVCFGERGDSLHFFKRKKNPYLQ